MKDKISSKMNNGYKIYLEEFSCNGFHYAGGYLNDSLWQNAPIYGRVSFDEASSFSKDGVIKKIDNLREWGYPCHSVPSIVIPIQVY